MRSFQFPPESLYELINTPEAWKACPGAPMWCYDGQFIWLYTKEYKRKTDILPGPENKVIDK